MGRRIPRLVVVALALILLASPAAADEGWTIERFAVDIAIEENGDLLVDERIEVDFPSPMHGIFRSVPYRYRWDDERDRVYQLAVLAVTDEQGRAWRVEESRQGADVVLKIGDPDRTIRGRQTYRIRYRVGGALNAFADHDELYWNVNGTDWDVPARLVTSTVRAPREGVLRVACFQGRLGSTESCAGRLTSREASFSATRLFGSGENLTIVVGLAKGVVPEPRPNLERRARDVEAWFDATPATLGVSVFVLVAGLTLVAYNWYLRGRDRVYTTNYYLTNDPAEDVRPLFGGPAIVPEYEPPDRLRPAQLGLVLDESADPKDVTATIVDLASRGHLTIAEIPKQILFGQRDWEIRKAKAPDAGALEEFERTIYDELFDDREAVKVSALKGKFLKTLVRAQKQLYAGAVERRWFSADPEWARIRWAGLGLGVVLVGAGAAIGLGMLAGWGLVGVALALAGVALIAMSKSMPSRTASGSDLLRRILGFRIYMLSAEKERQRFAEREGIFSAYLPYAIVFGCVERWVAAFRDLGAAAQSVSWYAGSGTFNANAFSSDLRSFSSGLASSVASSPGGSGSSGFSGGSSGGGGGGGGGGGW